MVKDYITPYGYNILKEELHNLVTKARPDLVQVISWAAGNGDRSENADYIYGKRKLREIDRRIYFLTKVLANIQVVEYLTHQGSQKIFFGATVVLLRDSKLQDAVKIVGQNEIDLLVNYISWRSPLARQLLGKEEGDTFIFRSVSGTNKMQILSVEYV